jgi:hypothetical protein
MLLLKERGLRFALDFEVIRGLLILECIADKIESRVCQEIYQNITLSLNGKKKYSILHGVT